MKILEKIKKLLQKLITGLKEFTTYSYTVTVTDGRETVTKTGNLTTIVSISEWTFEYVGKYETFIAPYTGTYRIELWGAQGGGRHGGAGGGSYELYTCYGGAGGGLIGKDGLRYLLSSDSSNHTIASGGTQIIGGAAGQGTVNSGLAGGFGYGGNGHLSYLAGGGSGYYGGGASGVNDTIAGTGAGGSSFISGHNGCNAISAESTESNVIHVGHSVHYSGYQFTETIMIDGEGYNWTNEKGAYIGMPTKDGISTMTGNTGNGYAKITFIPTACQHNYVDGICTICGKECTHIYVNRVCTICGKITGNTAPTITANADYKDGKTTSKFTIQMSATDVEGDSLTYELFYSISENGTYTSAGTSTVAAGTTTTIATPATLSEYYPYWWYITVTDGELTATSAKQSLRTYCPGGTTCPLATYCSAGYSSWPCTQCSGNGATLCNGRFGSYRVQDDYTGTSSWVSFICDVCNESVRAKIRYEYSCSMCVYSEDACANCIANVSSWSSSWTCPKYWSCDECNGFGYKESIAAVCPTHTSCTPRHYWCSTHSCQTSGTNHTINCSHGSSVKHDS